MKSLEKLAVGCAAVLALNGCVIGGTEGEPNLDLRVRGTVTTEKGEPIEGIRVIVSRDTCYTDGEGQYETALLNRPPCDFRTAYFDDVDGEANGGAFASDSVLLTSVERVMVKEGDGGRYAGEYEYTIDVKMRAAE